jgi:DNA-binding XRE family transcriptional regulator
MVDLKKIKAIRAKLGLTQGEAAKRAGLRSRQHWNKIEVGGDGGITVATLGERGQETYSNKRSQ